MNISHVLMSYFRSLCNFRWFQNGKRKPHSPFCFSNLLSLWRYSQTLTEQVFPHRRHSLNVRFHVTTQKHLFLSINSGRKDVWQRNTPFIQILDFVEIPVECADILWLDGYLDMSCAERRQFLHSILGSPALLEVFTQRLHAEKHSEFDYTALSIFLLFQLKFFVSPQAP